MRVVIALDVDGTLSTSSGPVTIARLHELQSLGVEIWIVSPSGKRPGAEEGFKEFVNLDRLSNLIAVRDTAPDEVDGVYLYVSDNKDYDIAKQAGFSYIEASQFI